MRRLITTADDFGLTDGVNAAVESAHRDGILSSASLMVSAPSASDAVARAHTLPGLAVGLHVVVIEGTPTLQPEQVPDLVDTSGRFPSDQLRLGLKYFLRPRVRRQLAAEIRAQFAAFAATGLTLDHANAHKHMHLHPTVGRMVIDIGRGFGLRALRVPCEPPLACMPKQGAGALALRLWTRVLRAQARRGGLLTNDHVLGLARTGAMTHEPLCRLLAALPDGLTELYMHPAITRCAALHALMPGYDPLGEYQALLRAKLPKGVCLTTYGAQCGVATTAEKDRFLKKP